MLFRRVRNSPGAISRQPEEIRFPRFGAWDAAPIRAGSRGKPVRGGRLESVSFDVRPAVVVETFRWNVSCAIERPSEAPSSAGDDPPGRLYKAADGSGAEDAVVTTGFCVTRSLPGGLTRYL